MERVRYGATTAAKEEGLTGTRSDSSCCRTLREDQCPRARTRVDAGRGSGGKHDQRVQGPGDWDCRSTTPEEQQRTACLACLTARSGKMDGFDSPTGPVGYSSNGGPLAERQEDAGSTGTWWGSVSGLWLRDRSSNPPGPVPTPLCDYQACSWPRVCLAAEG